jgi:hypothetical protein
MKYKTGEKPVVAQEKLMGRSNGAQTVSKLSNAPIQSGLMNSDVKIIIKNRQWFMISDFEFHTFEKSNARNN